MHPMWIDFVLMYAVLLATGLLSSKCRNRGSR